VESAVRSSPEKKHPAHFIVGAFVLSAGYLAALVAVDFLLLR
jgi:tRNA G37 N-methylase TrmD